MYSHPFFFSILFIFWNLDILLLITDPWLWVILSPAGQNNDYGPVFTFMDIKIVIKVSLKLICLESSSRRAILYKDKPKI